MRTSRLKAKKWLEKAPVRDTKLDKSKFSSVCPVFILLKVLSTLHTSSAASFARAVRIMESIKNKFFGKYRTNYFTLSLNIRIVKELLQISQIFDCLLEYRKYFFLGFRLVWETEPRAMIKY